MKKLAIFLILLVTTLMFTIQSTYAVDTTVENEISDELIWTRAANGGYYFVQSNRFLIDFDVIRMEFNTTLGEWIEAFVATAGPYNSVVEVFNDDDPFSTPIKTFTIGYEAPGVTEVMFLFDDTPLDFDVDMDAYTNKYLQITLLLNPNPEPTSPSLVNNVQHWMNNYRGEYDFIITEIRTLLLDQTVADLPTTEGSPEESGQIGSVTDWNYNSTSGIFGAKVQYYQEYNLAIENVAFTDASFLDRVSSIDYYTLNGDKFFQFNFIDNPNVLITGSGQFAKEWNGFALWNLSTNEFVQYNKALAITYIEVTENREIFGYLYLPGIPMDDLLAVSGNFNYRYGYKNLIGVQRYNDWEKAVFHLEKDQQSSGSQSLFEGTLPQWSYDVLSTSLAAVSVGTILSMVPGLQVIGIPLLAAGVAGIVATNISAITHVKTGLIDEIQLATLTPQLRNTLNEHYTEAAGALTVLPSNAQVHKLFFGLFTKPNTNVVEPDASSLVYTEITWATKGQVYTLDEKFIDSESILDQDYLDSLPPEGEGGWFDQWFGEYAQIAKGALIIFGVLFIAPYLDKGSTSIKNIFRDKRKLVIVAIIILFLLFFTGVIRL